MQISDNYTAFCFDEACAYIQMMLEQGEKAPRWAEDFAEAKEKDTIAFLLEQERNLKY